MASVNKGQGRVDPRLDTLCSVPSPDSVSISNPTILNTEEGLNTTYKINP